MTESIYEMKSVCPRAEICGGCAMQGVPYEEQLARKAEACRTFFADNGISPDWIGDPVPSPGIYSYRNKMEYTFGDEYIGGPLNLGMHKRKNYMCIVEAGCCQIVPEDFNRILNATLAFCRERGYSFYHKKRHAGLLRSLIIRHGVRTGELLVNIVTSSQEDFDEQSYLNLILSTRTDAAVVGVLRTINDNIADAVNCDELRVLYGKTYYMEQIMGLKFKVGAFSFFQANVAAAERLYQDAIRLIEGLEGKTVYDLYCGTGTISQAMALKAEKVIGVEIVEDAVASARANVILNGLSNCEFICGDVLQVLDGIQEKPDVIVVDPPRSGIHPKAMKKICSYGVPQIVYVSCNPKTLAVNLKACAEYGYYPVSVRGYDNFAFTEHTEMIVLLEKKDKE